MKGPFPKVMIFNVDWVKVENADEITYKDLLMVYMLFNQKFKLDELCEAVDSD